MIESLCSGKRAIHLLGHEGRERINHEEIALLT
jgi:hypothetical protein